MLVLEFAQLAIKLFGAGFLGYLTFLSFYRLWLHPLAAFPGPRIAACTSWWLWYWEVHREGQLTDHLQSMHQKYGAVVRIGPNHLNFGNPDHYSEVYRFRNSFAKDTDFYGSGSSTFREIDIERHRIRRQAVGKAFNRAKVLQEQSMIRSNCTRLVNCLLQRCAPGQNYVFNALNACRCLSADIISEFVLGDSFGCLNEGGENFDARYLLALDKSRNAFWLRKSFVSRWINQLRLPSISSQLFGKYDMKALEGGYADEFAQTDSKIDLFLHSRDSLEEKEFRPALDYLLDSSTAKDFTSLSKSLLYAEGRNQLAAGVDTEGFSISTTMIYVVRDSQVKEALESELLSSFPTLKSFSEVTYEKLLKLPFLSACIKEGFRLSMTVPGRLPRVVGPSDTTIGGFSIPKGTTIGMSIQLCHTNGEIFKDPWSFQPGRWMDHAQIHRTAFSEPRSVDHYLVPFGAGTRRCIGEHVAICEAYFAIAMLFRIFHVEDRMQGADLKFEETFIRYVKPQTIPLSVMPRTE